MDKIEDVYKQYREMMKEKQEGINQIEEGLILVHAVNVFCGLQCIDRQGQQITFPQNWRQSTQGVYKYHYTLKKQTVMFRMINNDGISLSVNYTTTNSQELHKIQLQFNQSEVQTLLIKYQKQIKDNLFEKQKQQKSKPVSQPADLQPRWRQPIYNNPPPRAPWNIPPPNQGGNFDLPNNRGEYVGPNSHMFEGRRDLRINPQRPMGARFDPTDPFSDEIPSQFPKNNPNDFTGFDSWGHPKGGFGGGNERNFF